MKFLLTSGGITNKSIAKALFDLVGKKANKINIAFIPTAANVIQDDKSWLIDDLYNLRKQDFKRIDIVDISALPKENWQPRLEAADILFFSGGNTFHLMYWLKKSGLAKMLPKLLKTRVYAGISAGSMATTKDLHLSSAKRLYYDEQGRADGRGLGYFDFYFRPHLNSSDFPKVRKKFLERMRKELKDPIYALDDQSALKIIDDKIEVVGGGKYLKI
jgi:dipeptidase E